MSRRTGSGGITRPLMAEFSDVQHLQMLFADSSSPSLFDGRTHFRISVSLRDILEHATDHSIMLSDPCIALQRELVIDNAIMQIRNRAEKVKTPDSNNAKRRKVTKYGVLIQR